MVRVGKVGRGEEGAWSEAKVVAVAVVAERCLAAFGAGHVGSAERQRTQCLANACGHVRSTHGGADAFVRPGDVVCFHEVFGGGVGERFEVCGGASASNGSFSAVEQLHAASHVEEHCEYIGLEPVLFVMGGCVQRFCLDFCLNNLFRHLG